MTGDAPDVERFLALVARLEAEDASLTSLQAGLVAAAALDIARDSRTFARLLGVAHALVLRDLNGLAERGDVLHIETRDGRTMRTHYALGAGADRFAAIFQASGPA